MDATDIASRFLLGEVLKAANARWKAQPIAYTLMRKEDQEKLLREIADQVAEAVHQAVEIIASDNRLMFRAECESVTFKDGVKAVVKLANTPHAHALADCAGASLMVVLEDAGRYLNPGDAIRGEDDQLALMREP